MPNRKKFLVSLQIKEHRLSNKTPEYSVYFDGKPVDNKAISCDIGTHTLSVCLHNKDPNDTVVENGKITQDLAVEIEKIMIDEVDVTHLAKEKAIYKTNDGVENTYGYLHKNGTFTVTLECPPFYFLRNLQVIKNICK